MLPRCMVLAKVGVVSHRRQGRRSASLGIVTGVSIAAVDHTVVNLLEWLTSRRDGCQAGSLDLRVVRLFREGRADFRSGRPGSDGGGEC